MPPVIATWGDWIAVEEVDGVPFRMYAERPRRIESLLPLASRWGARPHIVQGDRVVSFAGLQAAVAAKAAALRALGLKPGDRVFLVGWNSPEWVVNFWACLAGGTVPVLGNAWWTAAELTGAVAALQPALVLADAGSGEKVPDGAKLGPWEIDTSGSVRRDWRDGVPAVHLPEEETAVIIFTSGTSGEPKAVVLSHRAVLARLHMTLHVTRKLPHQVEEAAHDVTLVTGPLFHVGGMQGLLRAVVVGDTLVLPRGRYDPGEVLDLIERHKVRRWNAVPTMVSRLLDRQDIAQRDLGSLKSISVGGAPVPAELMQRMRTGLPGVSPRVPTGYGLTENGGQATASAGAETPGQLGSTGRPMPCVEIRFLEHPGLPDAEILLRSPTQMTGYFGLEESPIDREGWLHTGDLGRLDEKGNLWITGRCKEMIIRGGENIAPAAVERALAAVPGVAECAVFGVPHPDLGEEVMAVVVVDGGLTPDRIAEHLRTNLASFAVPSRWHLQRERLPTNQVGKIDKKALMAQILRPSPAIAGPQVRSFQHITPPLRLFAGPDSLAQLGRELDRLECRRAVIFCGSTLGRAGSPLELVRAALGDRCAGVFSGVRAHSPVPAVEAGARELKRLEADAVIAVGGGSAIVTARAASILLAEPGEARALCTTRDAKGDLKSPKLLARKLPQLLIPTTPTTATAKAGSAVFDPATQERLALFDPKTRAHAVFIQPDLLQTAPRGLVVSASLNALAMAIEGLMSRTGDSISDALLMHSLRLLLVHLPAGDDPAARGELVLAALLCGQGTDYTGAGITTVLGHAVGARFQVENGVANAIVLPHALRFNGGAAAAGLSKVAAAFGSDAIPAVEALLNRLGIPRQLRDIGVPREALAGIAATAMGDWFLRGNPRPVLAASELEQVLKESLVMGAIPDLAVDLARFAANIDPAQLDGDVTRAAKATILDTLSCALAGSSAAGVSEVAGLVREWAGAPQADLLVLGGKFPAHHAAWVNGVMCHARDYDDTHDAAMLHAGVTAVPAALAAAQLRGAGVLHPPSPLSGADFIASVAAGLEVTCRLGAAIKVDIVESGFIYTSLLGYFGATAAAGRALGLTRDEMMNAFGIIYSSVAGNHQVTRDASLMKRVQPGLAAQAAVVAVQLARRGIRGAHAVFEGADGFFRVYLRNRVDREAVSRDLGRRFELLNLSYKPYPCCRDVHSAVDAVLQLRGSAPRAAAEIQSIRVGVTAPGYQMVCTPEAVRAMPRTIVEAQFSIPYAVAAAWIDGRLGLRHFSDEAVRRKDILELACRVQPCVDEEIDREWSRFITPARVAVRFRDGSTAEARIDYSKGHPKNAMSAAEFAAKAADCAACAAGNLPADTAERLVATVAGLEKLPDLNELLRIMT